MNSEDIWHAVDTERRRLLQLLEQLSASQWRHASLCDRWQVRDVVAHVALSTHAHVGRILVNLVRARGNLDRMVCDTAVRHAARTSDRDLLGEVHGTVGSRFTAVGTTPTDRLMDLLVHGQDIAVPLGLHHEMPAETAQLALEHIWHPRFPFRAATKLAPYRLRAVDTDWAAGDSPLVEGPVSALLLLATGRDAAALPQLRGAGVTSLRRAVPREREGPPTESH
ncbi:maleylpyruvate isomerase family mycothiol-dependent enzyme [Mycolicibacterium setense]